VRGHPAGDNADRLSSHHAVNERQKELGIELEAEFEADRLGDDPD
jgi:hypothetical protein